MAQYYFHLSDGETILDDKGSELPDSASVRDETVRVTRDLLNVRQSNELWIGKPWRVWVTDQPNGAGRTLATIEVTASWSA
jgi:hypothetical protein